MKLRKLLAGFVSAAMVMGMTAMPSFADGSSEMSYGEFLEAVENSGYNYDGQGVVVTLKTMLM